MVTNEILVSVFCTTYNHEAYIKEAIEGFLIQKTTFPIEVIIHDDASTDKTAEIVRSYAEQYPDKIVAILQKNNQFTNGIDVYKAFIWPRARGKYIALCEGDDYWTDPYKLQKQVDFLEKNRSFTFCVHRYKRYYCNQKTYADDLFPELFLDINGIVIDKSIYSKYWLTQPLTALIRRDSLSEVFLLVSHFNYFRDFHLFYLLLNNGNGFCMNFNGGVYNIHDGGIQAGLPIKKQIISNFNVIRELYLYCPDSTLELWLIKCVFGLIKSQKSITPLFLMFLLDVSLTAKFRLFHRLIKVLIKKIIHS